MVLVRKLKTLFRLRKKSTRVMLHEVLLEQAIRRHPAKGVRHGLHD